MFCEKCGANNPDNAQMCMSCGAPMSAPEMPKKNTKKTVIIVVAVLLVLAIIGIIPEILPLGGHKEPIDNLVKFMETGDEEYFYDVMPESMVESLSDSEKEMISGIFETAFESLDIESVEYEIIDEDELDEDELKDFEETLEEGIDDDVDVEVTKGYSCEVEMTMTAEVDGETEEKTEEMTLDVYKVDGKWCLDIFNMM